MKFNCKNVAMSTAALISLMLCTAFQSKEVSAKTEEIQFSVDEEDSNEKHNPNEILSSELIEYNKTDEIIEDMNVVIEPSINISLKTKEGIKKYSTTATTVDEFLHEIGYKKVDGDVITPSRSTKISDSSKITIVENRKIKYTTKSKVKYKTSKKYSMKLNYGKKKTSKNGKNGVEETTYVETTKDGKRISKKEVSSKITKKPVGKVVLIGAKDVKSKNINYKTKKVRSNKITKGKTKIVKKGTKGKRKLTYYNTGKKKKLVSSVVTKYSSPRVIAVGTKKKAPSSKSVAKVSLSQFKFNGIVHSNGRKFSYYSQSVLPGGSLRIPGRHVNAAGFVADGNGYIVLAGGSGVSKGSVISTPFGAKGKVYDRCVGCHSKWYDVYVR